MVDDCLKAVGQIACARHGLELFEFDRGLHRPNTSRQILPVMLIAQKADLQSQHTYYLQPS